MCYHVSINKNREEIEQRFNAKFIQPDLFKPVFYANGFDFPRLPVITQEQPEIIQLFNWGLIPHWVKSDKDALKARSYNLNARSESVFDKPSFSQPIRQQRCLILIDGFYEWRTFKDKKYPYFIKMKDNQAFALAGIYDSWDKQKTCSVITTTANALLAKIHNIKLRMPVIFNKEEEQIWLAKTAKEESIKQLMNPFDSQQLTAYPISKLITARGINRNVPAILAPFKYKELPNL